ncbi:hypothetical protein [Sutcliffiella deserti]|uniref:hypothetical protein n=1 Tax=Sutcliffiella deserti TaxID=2875501 RepID=UPI001CBC01B0|nr:hypothetical protein [Sutcliffiella deserti]
MTSFNETAVISYVTTITKEYREKMEQVNPGEIEHEVLLGKIEAFNEFLEHFGYNSVDFKI